MNILNDTQRQYKDFSDKMRIRIRQMEAGIALYENILDAYRLVLDEQSKTEDEKVLDLHQKLMALQKGVDERSKIIQDGESQLLGFQDACHKKKKEADLQALSQKAFIRLKEEELKSYLAEYEARIDARNAARSRIEDIENEVSVLKDEIEKTCLAHIEQARTSYMERLQGDIDALAAGFFDVPSILPEQASDYARSEEYLNATLEYKQAYNRLTVFMNGVFDAMQSFLSNANTETILPGLLAMQNECKGKYSMMDEVENQISEIDDFLRLRESHEQVLQNEQTELEKIKSSVGQDEGLLRLKKEIEEYMTRYEGFLL